MGVRTSIGYAGSGPDITYATDKYQEDDCCDAQKAPLHRLSSLRAIVKPWSIYIERRENGHSL